jgi:serine/threonine protein kinase/tetratricopeptide (TPR) repeat protein
MPDGHESSTALVGTPSPIFSPGTVICERYEVIRFIARGGMGEVYEVEDRELKARVALKTIAPSRASSLRQVSRFRQEIQLARQVTHPNVCRVFDLGRDSSNPNGDVLFLTMELLEGETLAAFLQRRGPMTCEEALPVVRQMVAALSAAHQSGIVHRDFKPGNVILLQTPRGTEVKVTDFGLAVSPDGDETASGSLADIVGTPEYMAPEQFQGQYSVRTDVYALGVTVFQMLWGKLPASHDTPFKTLGTHTTKRVVARWQAAIGKCISVNPSSRFESVEDFWRALAGENRKWHPGRRSWIATAALVVLVLTGALLLGAGVVPNPFKRLPEQKHIAVLPFQNIGNNAMNQAFADGVAESLTSKLSQLERYQKSFWVVPSSDTRNLKSLNEAYRNLSVTLAVTGSVQCTPEGVDLTANLVDPKNHRQLASRSMHVNSANLDEMQQRVWESVADMLDLQINQQMKQELAAGGTRQPSAYELYEQGVGYLHRLDTGDLDRALSSFNEALVKDPQYALAYAGLGSAYASKYRNTKDPQWIEYATKNANRAVELNADLVPARVALGSVYQKTGQLDKALVEYQRVLSEDPSVIDAQYHIGEIYKLKGEPGKAEEAYKRAITRRPSYSQGYSELGELYYENGQFANAAQQFETAIRLAPDNPLGYFNLGAAYLGAGRNQDAIRILKQGLEIAPNSNAWTNLGSAYMYVGKNDEAIEAMKKAAELAPHNHVMWRNLGDSYDPFPSRSAEAKEAYRKALETALEQQKINPNDPETLSGIALYYAHLGETKDARQYIQRSIDLSPRNSDSLFTSALVYEIIGNRARALTAVEEAVNTGYSLEEVDKEPELRKLRSDPRYQRWLQQRTKATNHTAATGTGGSA